MAKHDVLYPLILAEMPGCPLPTVRLMLNRAGIELCERGRAWQPEMEPISVVPGRWRYEVDLPPGARIAVIDSVRLDGRPLNGLNDSRNAQQWGRIAGPPMRYALLPGWVEIGLDPEPVQIGTLTMSASLLPTLDAAELPDDLVSRNFEALAEGAKAFLKRMPNQPWSDPGGAVASYQLFQRHIDTARIAAEYGRTAGSLSVKPRPFGG